MLVQKYISKVEVTSTFCTDNDPSSINPNASNQLHPKHSPQTLPDKRISQKNTKDCS